METKHTPGPWTREKDERFKHDRSAGVKAASGQYIAAALDRNRYDLDEEVEANARLIAAAPDLLEELDNLVGVIGILKKMVGERADGINLSFAKELIARTNTTS